MIEAPSGRIFAQGDPVGWGDVGGGVELHHEDAKAKRGTTDEHR